MKCWSCGHVNPSGVNICQLCGMWLEQNKSTIDQSTSTYGSIYGTSYGSSQTQYGQQSSAQANLSYNEHYAASYNPRPGPKYTPPAYSQHPDFKLGQLGLGKWDTMNVALGLGSLMTLIGIFVAFLIFDLFYEFPLIGFIFVYFIVIMPLAGTILIGTGYLKTGGVVLGIGSVLMIPIGIIGIFGGRIAFKLAKAKELIKNQNREGEPSFAPLLKQYHMGIKVAGIVIIIIALILPMVFYNSYIDQPLPKIKDATTPSYSFGYGGDTTTLTVKLINVGNQEAQGEKIQIKITFSDGSENYDWEGGDIKSQSTVTDEISIPYDRTLEEISVYYDGKITDTKYFESAY